MITIFRKIRQKLLSEGKTGKPALPAGRYLKYAVGEIILVVIGILIALQINNWNESRKQEQAEMAFLKGIKNDLEQDKLFIIEVLNTMKPKLEAYNQLNTESIDIEKDKIVIDSLFKRYIDTGQRTFYPISGSYQAAISGNQINTYKNKKIIQSIIKLYNSTYERLIDNGKIVDDRWSDISKKYIHERRSKKFNISDDLQLSKTLDDLYFHFIQMTWYETVLVNASKEIDNLLQEIQNKY